MDDAPAERSPPPDRTCQNCRAPLLGEHCYSCGQPTKGLIRHFSSIVGDFLDSVFDFDSRTFRTLGPLLFKPGHLSNEYFAGRRVAYVSPVRLFAFLCIVAFFVLKFTVDPNIVSDGDDDADASVHSAQTVAEAEVFRDQADQALQRVADRLSDPTTLADVTPQLLALKADAERRIDWLRARDVALAAGTAVPPEPEGSVRSEPAITFGDQDHPWDAVSNPVTFDWLSPALNDWLNQQIGRAQQNAERVRKEPALLVDTFLQTLPQTFFVLLPLFALLLKFAYLFKRRLYMEHLIVALHSHAFLCLCLLLLVGVDQLGGLVGEGRVAAGLGWTEVGIAVWMPLYLLITQKRVYRQGWVMTLFKFLLLGLAYSILLSIGAMVNLMLNLVTM